MATLQSLISYLERGFTIQNVRGESLRMVDTWVEWRHHTWSGRLEAEKCSLAQVSGIKDMWEWGVLFSLPFSNGKGELATTIEEIEDLIELGVPGLAYRQKEI
jgi:hypothetical protein